MTDELRSAAGRLLRPTGCVQTFDHCWAAGRCLHCGMELRAFDAARVAQAYLAEHLADDGEAVTPGWLEAIGFRDGDESQGISAANGTTLEFSGIGWFYGFDSEPLPDQPTRGHVRRLAAALGIPLTEAP